MTHTFFDPDRVDWGPFLSMQEGGGGASERYFQGTKYQRGYGLISNIARFLMPITKNIIHSASQEGITAGTRILSDIQEGKNLKESLKEHTQKGLANLAGKLQQCGKGKRRRRPPKNVLVNVRPLGEQKKRVRDQLSFV